MTFTDVLGNNLFYLPPHIELPNPTRPPKHTFIKPYRKTQIDDPRRQSMKHPAKQETHPKKPLESNLELYPGLHLSLTSSIIDPIPILNQTQTYIQLLEPSRTRPDQTSQKLARIRGYIRRLIKDKT